MVIHSASRASSTASVAGGGYQHESVDRAVAGEFQEEGPHEQLKGHEGGGRVSRQAEHRQRIRPFPGEVTEAEGASGPQLHTPEVELVPEVDEHALDQVALAHGGARDGDQRVRPHRALQMLAKVVDVVAGDAERKSETARRERRSPEGVAVALGDGGALKDALELARRRQFITVCENRHGGPATHLDLRGTRRGRDTNSSRSERYAGFQHHVAGRTIQSPRANVPSNIGIATDQHRPRGRAFPVRVLDPYHRVRTLRNRTARHDADGGAGLEGEPAGWTRKDVPGDR